MLVSGLFTSDGHSKSLVSSATKALGSLHKEQTLKTPKGKRSTASMKMQGTNELVENKMAVQPPNVADINRAVVRHVTKGLNSKLAVSRSPFAGNLQIFNPQDCWVTLPAVPAAVGSLAGAYRDQIISVFDSLATPVPLKSYKSVSRGAALAWLRAAIGNFQHHSLAAAIFDRWNVRSSRTLDPWGLRAGEFGNFIAETLQKVASIELLDRKFPENFLNGLDVTAISMVEWSTLSVFEPEVQMWMLYHENLFRKIYQIYFTAGEPFSKSQENFLTLLKDLEIIPQLLNTVQASEIIRSSRGAQPNRKAAPVVTLANTRKTVRKGAPAMGWNRKADDKKQRKTVTDSQIAPIPDPEPEPECLFTVDTLTECLARIPSAYFPLYGNIFQVRLTTLGRLAWFTEFLKGAWVGLYERDIGEGSKIFQLRRALCVSDFAPDGPCNTEAICEVCGACGSLWGNFGCYTCNRMTREKLNIESLAPFTTIFPNFLKNDKVSTFLAELDMRKTQSSFANTTQ